MTHESRVTTHFRRACCVFRSDSLCRGKWAATGALLSIQLQHHTPLIPVSSVSQLVELSAKFRIILSLTSPSRLAHSLHDIDLQDYDFNPWLADLLPPMRPLVWSLVLRIFPRLLAKHECEKAFETALFSAHALPSETLKQIEVNELHSELHALLQC
jgi:hypothetical protein